MQRIARHSLLTLLVTVVAASCVPASSLERGVPSGEAWRATGAAMSVAGFTGALTAGSIFQAWLLQPGLLESGVVSAVGSWEMAGYFADTGEQIAGLELEASASQHYAFQQHTEFTFAAVARWHAFVFDDTVVATASIGQGLSWASSVPRIETERWGEATRLLSYNSYEFTLASPERPNVELVFRLHHRSGVWGLFGNVEEGSNLAMLGLKYRFPLF